MKHIAITVVCLVAIGCYTVFSCIYTDKIYLKLCSDIAPFKTEDYTDEDIGRLKDDFEKNRTVLLIMINEELVNETEEIITKLEYAVSFDNKQDISTCCQLLLNTADEIKRTSRSLY